MSEGKHAEDEPEGKYEGKDGGDEGKDGGELDEERLMMCVDRLSDCLLGDFMPGESSPAEGEGKDGEESLAQAAQRHTASILSEFRRADEELDGGSDFSPQHTVLHQSFVLVIEEKLESEVSKEGIGLRQFETGIRRALQSSDSARWARAGAQEVVDLIDEVSDFERWARGMRVELENVR